MSDEETTTVHYTVKILEEGVVKPRVVMLGVNTVVATFDARDDGSIGVEIISGLPPELLAEFFEDSANSIRKNISEEGH